MGEDYLRSLKSYLESQIRVLRDERIENVVKIQSYENFLEKVETAIDRRERAEEGGDQ